MLGGRFQLGRNGCGYQVSGKAFPSLALGQRIELLQYTASQIESCSVAITPTTHLVVTKRIDNYLPDGATDPLLGYPETQPILQVQVELPRAGEDTMFVERVFI